MNLFRDREDPVQIYVMIKNKLTHHLLKDFYLSNAISLGKRLHEALPDEYLNTKQYIHEVIKALMSKVGDTSFNRKMGLKMTSMMLGPHHQPKFDNLLDRLEDNPILKEPFDRETRHKMIDNIKHLEGHEKLGGLHNLSKKQLDLVALYASNKIAKPVKHKKRSKGEKRDRDNNKREGRDGRKPKKRSKKSKGEAVEAKKSPKEASKGEKGAKLDKIAKKDLQKIIKIAEVCSNLC